MERQMNSKEYMKMAMLKQEETFRNQVQELHRLYRIQRQLMKDTTPPTKMHKSTNTELKFDISNSENSSDKRIPRREIDLRLEAQAYITKDNSEFGQEIDEENDLELSLGIGCSNRRKKKNKETSFTSDSASNFSSSSTESGLAKTNNSNEWGVFQAQDVLMRLQHDTKNGVEFDEKIRQNGLKQSSPFLQCLSLTMS